MRAIDKRIKIGTLVLVGIDDTPTWHKVREVICPWIKIEGIGGSWQMNHIIKFKNEL